MMTSISLFKNIINLREFEEYFLKEIAARILAIPGVIRMRVNTIQTDTAVAQEVSGVQYIVETYYESQQVFNDMLQSPEGQELMHAAANIPTGNLSSFIGKEITLTPQDFSNFSKNHSNHLPTE